jgi:hypothetical protein
MSGVIDALHPAIRTVVVTAMLTLLVNAGYGLAAGVGLALIVLAVGWLRGGLNFWLPPNAAMATFGGWLGGWIAGRT